MLNKKGELVTLEEIVKFLPKVLLFLALLFFIYGIIDAIFSKRPTLASLDFDRVSRDIEFLDKDEIVRTPISTKWYIKQNDVYEYRFYKSGKDKFHHPNCPDYTEACICLLGGDTPECRSFKNVDFKIEGSKTKDGIVLQINPNNLQYYIEMKKDCNEGICFVDLALK